MARDAKQHKLKNGDRVNVPCTILHIDDEKNEVVVSTALNTAALIEKQVILCGSQMKKTAAKG